MWLLLPLLLFPLASLPRAAQGGSHLNFTFTRDQRRCKFRLRGDVEEFHMDLRPHGTVKDGIQTCGHLPQTTRAHPHDTPLTNPPVSHCVTVWEEVGEGETEVLVQGCWYGHYAPNCDGACVAREPFPEQHRNNTYMCCCDSDHCNGNFTYVPGPPPESGREKKDMDTVNIYFYTSAVSLGIFAFVAFVLARKFFRINPKEEELEAGEMGLLETERSPGPSPHLPLLQDPLDESQLNLGAVIGRGRFGIVFAATMDEEDVAVKIYQPYAREYFRNEATIYQTHSLRHPNLVRFIGWCSTEKDGESGTVQRALEDPATESLELSENAHPLCEPPSLLVESWLVMELAKGNLQQELRQRQLSWDEFLSFALDISSGLSFLHSQGAEKSIIAHRDLSSRNVLVSMDGGLKICDLGFSLSMADLPRSTGEEVVEEVEVGTVGTIRYMAPELLDGAVQLSDVASALKSADVYSLALLVWECLSRSSPILQLIPDPRWEEYAAPYAREFALTNGGKGSTMTLERMQFLVVKRRCRPAFPPGLQHYAGHETIRALRDVMEDSWDADPEARPSADCTLARLADLQTLPFPPLAQLLSESGPPPPPLQPFQDRNPCRERNVYSGSEDGSPPPPSTSENGQPPPFAALGEKPDPSDPATLHQLFTQPTHKASNEESKYLADFRAALCAAANADFMAPPTVKLLPDHSPKALTLSHANHLFGPSPFPSQPFPPARAAISDPPQPQHPAGSKKKKGKKEAKSDEVPRTPGQICA